MQGSKTALPKKVKNQQKAVKVGEHIHDMISREVGSRFKQIFRKITMTTTTAAIKTQLNTEF